MRSVSVEESKTCVCQLLEPGLKIVFRKKLDNLLILFIINLSGKFQQRTTVLILSPAQVNFLYKLWACLGRTWLNAGGVRRRVATQTPEFESWVDARDFYYSL